MSEENLTPDELKYICEVFFKGDQSKMLGKLILRREVAKKENARLFLDLIEKDIETLKKGVF